MRSGAFGRMMAALLLLTLAGCGGIRAAPEAPVADFEAALGGLQKEFLAPEVTQCLRHSLSSLQAQSCRDTIVQALMIAIDLRYQEFELGFFDAHRYAGFGATLATLGLSTAGAVVSGGASQLLSAAAAGVVGAREAFKREVLIEQTSVALLTAMNARRVQFRTRIYHGLRRSAIEYPLAVALADVSAYYRAGTIPGALQGVTQAVGTERSNAERNLEASLFGFQPSLPPPPVGGISALAPAGTPSGPAPASQPRPTGGSSAAASVGSPSSAAPAPPPPSSARPTRPPSPTLQNRPGGSKEPPPPVAEITEAEFVQLRDVFGLTDKNAPLEDRHKSQGFRNAVRAFHHCKNPSLPLSRQSGALTPDEKKIALQNTDLCLAKVRDSLGSKPGATGSSPSQPTQPATGSSPSQPAQPATGSPPSQPAQPATGQQTAPSDSTVSPTPPGGKK